MLTRNLRQKGAILIMTALLLPTLICATGLAVDFGNIFVQHHRLQNAADAAALAGAKSYDKYQETEKKHTKADKTAYQYIKGDFHNLNTDENILEPNYDAKKIGNDTYYRVKLEKYVPLYFLKLFISEKGNSEYKNGFKVSAESVASIQSSSQPETPSKSVFQNLFTFTDSFTGINTAQNPDKVKIAEISSTLTGRIVTNNQEAAKNYRHQLITNQAREKQQQNPNYTVQNAIDDGYVNDPICDEDVDLSFYKDTATRIGNNANKEFTENISQTISAQNHFNSSYISTNNNQSVIHYTSMNGGNISLDTNVTGNKNNPLYIIIDKAHNPQINFNANVKNTRPIIYCYLGTGDLWITGNSGVEFHGVIYAPDAIVRINDNGWKFYGSLVGKSFELNAKGDYTYEDFGISDSSSNGSSSGSNKPATNSTQIKLVSPKSINWD